MSNVGKYNFLSFFFLNTYFGQWKKKFIEMKKFIQEVYFWRGILDIQGCLNIFIFFKIVLYRTVIYFMFTFIDKLKYV